MAAKKKSVARAQEPTVAEALAGFDNVIDLPPGDLTTQVGTLIECPRCAKVFETPVDLPATYKVICGDPHRVESVG